MKKFTKLFSILTLILTVALTLCFAVGCNDADNKEEPWDGKTFVVYVYLADGTTPVKDIKLSLCYNISGSSSSCLSPLKTDAEGKVEFVIPESVNFVGNPVVHFDGGITHQYNLPSGYKMPANVGEVVMNHSADSDAANSTYEYALALSTKVTKLNLQVAN